jgi:hypothetical protein
MKKTIIFIFMLCVSQCLMAQKAKKAVAKKAETKAAEPEQQDYPRDCKNQLKYYEDGFQKNEMQNDNSFYNAACSAALCGDKTKAWKYLEMSINAGFKDYMHIFNDADLVSLHNDAKWKKMLNDKGIDVTKLKKVFANINTEVQLSNLVPFKKDDLWGYMEYGTKKIMVEPMFTDADFYYQHRGRYGNYKNNDEGKYIEIKKGTCKAWIKANNEIISEFPDINLPPPMDMNRIYGREEFRPKAEKDGPGFTEQLGTIVSYSKDYDSFQALKINNQTCALVKSKGIYGIINIDGEPILPIFALQYKSLVQSNIYDKERTIIFYAQNAADNKWSIIDAKGQVIFEDLDDEPEQSSVYYLIKSNGKWGAIDLKGTIVLAPKYKNKKKYIYAHYISGEVRYFFEFQLDGDFFYVDQNDVEYRN